ncbi:MAG TPA: hypothetical protein VHV75_10835 [Solirubrobacteraceae bacterium]|nr:hypothetical protein [Solirubrobacteraceae bacterium]
MSPVRSVKPGYVVTYPNREKPSSTVMKMTVIVVLLISVLLMLVATVGGWSKLDGLLPVNLIWCAAYLAIAYYVMRWTRGLLPIAAALGALMLVFTLVAVTSLAGVTWTDRSAPGYAPAHTLFGGGGLSSGTLSALTIAIAVSQALLIVVAMRGFGQAWNIEYEVPASDAPALVRA